MPFCPNCGAEIDAGVSFCPYCGGQVAQASQQPQEQQPFTGYQPPAAPEPPVQQFYPQPNDQQNYSQPYQQAYPASQQVEPVATGGLIAWSIITILLCWILGIAALIQTIGINKCATVEEQQKKMSTARTLCIVGTVVGLIVNIIYIVAQLNS